MITSIPKPLARVLVAASFYNIVLALINVSIPLRIISLNGGSREVSYAVTALNLTFMFSSILSGKFSDVLGRRRPFIISGASCILVSSALMMRGSIPTVYLAACVVAIGSGLIAPNLAMLSVEATGRGSVSLAISRYGLATGTGWFLGMTTGIVLSRVTLKLVIQAALVFSTAMLIYTVLRLPESKLTLERHPIAHSAPKLWVAERARLIFAVLIHPPRPIELAKAVRLLKKAFSKSIVLYLLAMMIAFTGIGVFFTQLAVYMKLVAGVDDSYVFGVHAVLALVSLVGFTTLPRVISVVNEAYVLAAGVIARGLVFIMPLMLRHGLEYVLILAPLLGLTWSAISLTSNIVMIKTSEPHRGGERLGELNAASSLGLTLGAFLSGLASRHGFTANFALASILMIVAGILIVAASKLAK